MKVLFLDFDGVLNCSTTTEKHRGFTGLDPKLIARLNRVVEETGTKICVSSTWRIGETVQSLQEILADAGANVEVIGKTPNLGPPRHNSSEGAWFVNDAFSSAPLMRYDRRGREIEHWLEEERKAGNVFESFAIVDDDHDAGECDSLEGRFIQTEFTYGLSEDDVDALIRVLNSSTVVTNEDDDAQDC